MTISQAPCKARYAVVKVSNYFAVKFNVADHENMTIMTSFIHKLLDFQGRLSIKVSSMGLRYAPSLIMAVLQQSDSLSEKPILKSSWDLTACRCHTIEEFRDFLGGYPLVSPTLIFSHSKLGILFTLGQKGI